MSPDPAALEAQVRPCIIHRHHPSGELTIEDPPDVTLVDAHFFETTAPHSLSPYVSFGDGILTIRTTSGPVSYGMVGYSPRFQAYIAVRGLLLSP